MLSRDMVMIILMMLVLTSIIKQLLILLLISMNSLCYSLRSNMYHLKYRYRSSFRLQRLSLSEINPYRAVRRYYARSANDDVGFDSKSYQSISSKANPQIALLQSLKLKKHRDKHQLILLEGHRQVLDAHACGLRPRVLLFTEDAVKASLGGRLIEMIRLLPHDILRLVDKNIMNFVSDTVTSQGIVAAFETPPKISLQSLSLTDKDAILVADNISDPGNMGTLIRSAYGFGINAVITIGGCDVWSPKVVRSSMGTCLQFPVIDSSWVELQASLTALSKTKASAAASYQIVLADAAIGSIPYDKCDFSLPTMLVLGAEADGISAEAMSMKSAVKVCIPMARPLESLNVAVAGGTIMAELCRQRRNKNN
jgi:RNA methyltransferase, TrmH family